MFHKTLVGLAAAIALGAASTSTLAQGTAITYQGQLKQFGTAVNNFADMQFSLWTAPSGGSQVGSTVTTPAVLVSNGLFTTPVDFGVNPYVNPQNLYLEIAVRTPSGSGPYVSMGSRQLLTAAPFSLATRGIKVDDLGRVALNPTGPGSQNDTSFIVNAINPGMLSSFNVSNGGFATRLETLIDATTDGNPGGARIRMQSPNVGYGPLTLNDAMTIEAGPNGGKVGIGTDGPFWKLNVATGLGDYGLVHMANTGNGGVVGTYVDENAGWLGTLSDHPLAFFTNGGGEAMLIDTDGRVGIGTTSPQVTLHVVGNIFATGSITPSCAKLKENVVPMSDALDRIAALDAVRFDWIADEAKTRGFTHDLGFIAEDVAKAFPEIVFRDKAGEIIGLDYSRMSAVAVGAIKQLKSENDQLKARLEKIEAILAAQAGNAAK